MALGTLLVVGAAGDVGRGVVAEGLAAGWNIVAAGRDLGRLEAMAACHPAVPLACIVGDIADEAGALRLWDAASAAFGGIDAAVVSVNALDRVQLLAEWQSEDISRFLADNLVTHFVAAKTFLPRLPASGMLIGVGGGTADVIFRGMAPMSMAQAALRMLYRALAKERAGGAELRELMIVSMVAGASNRGNARPEWVTAEEVGRHVCAVLADPHAFAGPVLHLRSSAQVGHPEPEMMAEKV